MSLEKLIEVARKRGDKIVAINDDCTAYCPTTGIAFPNKVEATERLTDSLRSQRVPAYMHAEILNDLTAHFQDYTDPDVLAENSFYGVWVREDGTECSSDEVGAEGGVCTEFGTYYTSLDLPSDVRPEHDPFEVRAQAYRAGD